MIINKYTYTFQKVTAIEKVDTDFWVAFETAPNLIGICNTDTPYIIDHTIELGDSNTSVLDIKYDSSNNLVYLLCSTNSDNRLIIYDSITRVWLHSSYQEDVFKIELSDTYTFLLKDTSPAQVYYFTLDDNYDIDVEGTITVTDSDYPKTFKWYSADNELYGINGSGAGELWRIEFDVSGIPTTRWDVVNGLNQVDLDINQSTKEFWILNSSDYAINGFLTSGDLLSETTYDIYTSGHTKLIGDFDNNQIIVVIAYDPTYVSIYNYDTTSVTAIDDFANSSSLISEGHYFDDVNRVLYLGIEETTGTIVKINLGSTVQLNTDLRTSITKSIDFTTRLHVLTNRETDCLDTDLRIKKELKPQLSTDIRAVRSTYTTIIPKSIDDIIVKKNGTTMTDVDHSTLNITYNLNSTPSQAEFTIARRHDNFHVKLSGVSDPVRITYRSIGDKITIYDGTRLLFTGYITSVVCEGRSDTTKIIAQDIRFKMNQYFPANKLSYGGKYDEDTKEVIAISTKTATETLLDEAIGSVGIAGYDAVPYGYVPEYVEEENNFASLLDNLVRNSATMNWYVDENEYIRFQKQGSEDVSEKDFNLSSLNENRHPYDIIEDTITVNSGNSGQIYTGATVIYGKDHKKRYTRVSYSGWGRMPTHLDKEFSTFAFQSFDYPGSPGTSGGLHYCGENVDTLYGYHNGLMSVDYYWIYQWLTEDIYTDIASVSIGSSDGATRKIYMTSYGKQTCNEKWIEQSTTTSSNLSSNEGAGTVGFSVTSTSDSEESLYLYSTREEQYDRTAYGLDLANFELAQGNNQKLDISFQILLDAIEYKNLSMKDAINITNLIDSTCFDDMLEGPWNGSLMIESYSINCGNRIVTINCSNGGKTYYVKTKNYMDNYIPPMEVRKAKRENVIQIL